MSTAARSEQDWKQEQGTPSLPPSRVAVGQVLGASSTAFPGALVGTWFGRTIGFQLMLQYRMSALQAVA